MAVDIALLDCSLGIQKASERMPQLIVYNKIIEE